MTINNVPTISPLNQNNLLSEIIDRVNEGFVGINSIVSHINTEICPILDNIGDTNNILGYDTLIEQTNYVYNLVNRLSSENGLTIEFIPTAPDITDCYGIRPFYFDTTEQVLKVFNSNDSQYYPVYGGASIQTVDCVPAPEYQLPECVNEPVIEEPPMEEECNTCCNNMCTCNTNMTVDPSCYVPNPILNDGFIRKLVDLPSSIDVISSITLGNITYIFSRNQNQMDLLAFDINNSVTTLIGNMNIYKRDFAIAPSPDNQTLWIIGGKNINDNISNEIINISLSDASVISTIVMPVQFMPSNISFNTAKDTAYFFGGVHFSNAGFVSPTNRIYKIDLTTGQFSEVGIMPLALMGASSTKFSNANNKVYIMGGRTSNAGTSASLLNDIYCFDTTTETLTYLTDMPVSRSDGILICGDCELYYFGGYKSNNNCFEKSTDLIKIIPHGNDWTYVDIGQFALPCNSLYSDELKECGYATLVVSNSLSNDGIYLMGI